MSAEPSPDPAAALAGHDAAPEAPPPVSAGYRRYALVVLMLIYVLNFLDRQVMSILAEPIKRELHLADWQLGLMTGLAFALLYTILGIPMARLSERANRPWIIGASVAVWSACTVACSAAGSFWQLVLARVGVGIGEAGCTPPAMSLITDYTPKEKRASALSVYLMGSPIGMMLGMALGGVIADLWGWRAAFLVAGAPGLLVAALAALTLVEPRRNAEWRQIQAPEIPLRAALSEFVGRRTYWLVVGGVTFMAFVSYGSHAFMGSFFLRNHADELARLGGLVGLKSIGFLGIALGLVTGVTAAAGSLVGGGLSDRLGKRDLRGYMVVPTVGSLLAIPFTLAVLSAPSAVGALALMLAPSFLNSLWLGPAYGTVQGLVRPANRATATAVLLFVANLLGLGLGPLCVGAISDFISGPLGQTGADAVRYSLIGVALLGLPAAALFWLARGTIVAETVS